ncbi:MAG: lipoyl(octanoyl) transferase [Microcystis panniformis Mp_MB_F_20051200_S9]|uniref:Octanoyltransferase n=1 Tax=Microcystis panniformis Mp_MB_F_20051200_S9 TaxID=2486223 RepID=A0A552PS06_9CHRO|nr:MAG: lipoyl(octanoyl) transferase [Microcystis panniformis Mp_GB_SS_20050300_S99D]TRV51030.1 MAG: lipoyl(octanoyl) transferase [Microcystis panniformis Mp_GB_SS_20050300_S99]TRV51507.1 MAG: lipoyl(octanoyl) transferase [Microcystis panniformis Mp_MB_F_20080800_S26D]TRV58133.1 MAG: lipoyl(octanoyl) transferase [Microcystis panniformis Mp_MB_F_20080800_S26]TRV59783.1 MAG: lipoyl(octanoyl) transferase [Microcystis panniformis Mp_MB_F_20051200_S9]TRV66671.1 MAG: lipoyl(octanoyl) transferase [Mi
MNAQKIPRLCGLKIQAITPYSLAWAHQRSLVEARIVNPDLPDILLLLEHPPVYTLGTGSDIKFVKFNLDKTDKEVHRIERGGEVTYHCPGQLVGYPILNLRYYQQDLHWYLRQLEEVILQTIAIYGLSGQRIGGLTGVWVEGYKIAAIGIKVSRWITYHGFAINVCPDLSGFAEIIPCGIANKPVGSLQQFLPNISLIEVQRDLSRVFASVFGVELFSLDKD